MARIQVWTDEWVRHVPYPATGETVFHDPQVSGHRFVITKSRKIFEVQRDRPRRFGPRKTFKVQTGDALTTAVEQARKNAVAALGQIAKGLSPHPAKEKPVVTTLRSAWKEFKGRNDLRPRTLTLYGDTYERSLKQWENETLATLAANPVMARDKHRSISETRGKRVANMAMTLLRAIHRHAARLDTSLSFERHPCTAVEFHNEKPREGAAIPAGELAGWFEQLEALRANSPIRASYHALCLRLGARPGELAARQWSDVDFDRKILTFPETKTHLVEMPLTEQCITELNRLKQVTRVLYPRSTHVFPARDGKHLSRFTEAKETLAYSGNCGRHSHHTIGVVLGIEELVLDALEGRTLLKAGLAGRGYIDRTELGPKIRAAQQLINDRIDELAKSAIQLPSEAQELFLVPSESLGAQHPPL
jgi:integrase